MKHLEAPAYLELVKRVKYNFKIIYFFRQGNRLN